MSDESDIHRALGELNGTLRGIGLMLDRHENAIVSHANELAETRGSTRANKWLAIVLPPAVVALVETVKSFFHAGVSH